MKRNTFFKKIAGIAAVVLTMGTLLVPMGVSATSETTYSITINDTNEGHHYVAYQIFKGDLSDDGILSNIEWGSGVTETAKTAIGSAKTKAESLTSETEARAFADLLQTNDYLSTTVSAEDTTVTESVGYELTGLAPGYYLVMDKANLSGQDTAATKYILKISDDTEIAPKVEKPTLEKKIWDGVEAPEMTGARTDANWVDVADNQIGDTVYFCIKSAVPDMSKYDAYKYVIRDSMSEGLTFNKVEKMFYVDSEDNKSEIYSYWANTTDDATTQDFTESFSISFDNLKTTLTNANGGYIYTYYTATLNDKAMASVSTNNTNSNPNTAYLSYSNNPDVSDSLGDTIQDTVYDWTFAFTAEKYTMTDSTKTPLGGAKFELQNSSGTKINLVEITSADELKLNGVTELASDTKYYRVALSTETDEVIITEDTKNKFVVLGLDDTVTYKLVEIEPPTGYNDCAPVSLSFTTAYDTVGSSLTTLTNSAGDLIGIENQKGSTLPSTGGIGTKIFYIGGGAVVVVAGVTLISKKRMSKK